MRIWVDLTNSPHVLVMGPVIRVLERRGNEVHVTARDFAQTLGLLDRFGIAHAAIGRHRGGRLGAKGLGLASRSLALANWAKGRRFDAALGHGSNDVTVADPYRANQSSALRRCDGLMCSLRPCFSRMSTRP